MSRNRRFANESTQTDISSEEVEEWMSVNRIRQAELPMEEQQRLQMANLAQQFADLQVQHQQTQQQLQQLLHQQGAVDAAQQPAVPPAQPQLKAPFIGKPPQFCLQTDKNSFKIFYEKWQMFQISSGLNMIADVDRAREAKRAALSAALSNDTIRFIQSNTNLSEDDKKDADLILQEIENFVKTSTNAVVSTLKMLARKQRSGESIDDLTNDLQELAESCDLDGIVDVKSWFLKVALVSNLSSNETRTKLMLRPDLSYNEAKALCITEENASKHSRQIVDPTNAEINKISKYKNAKKFGEKNEPQKFGKGSQSHGSKFQNKNFQKTEEKNCQRCGYKSHGQNKTCPAIGQQCKSCNRFGHYGKMCRNKSQNGSGKVNMMKTKLFSLHVNSTQVEELENVEIILKSGKFNFKTEALPDSGSNLNAIGVDDVVFLGEDAHNLIATHHRPTAADGHEIGTIGMIDNVEVTLGNVTMKTDFYVLKNLEKPILSRQTLKTLKLIPKKFPFVEVNSLEEKSERKDGEKVQQKHFCQPKEENEFEMLRKKYPTVFDGKIKIMKGKPARIELLPGSTPVSTGAFRSVPEPHMDALKVELDELLAQGIIEKVEGATEWLSPIVIVPKKGTNQIRMVVDPSALNRCIRKPVSSQMPPWEVVRKIPTGMKYFAIFDSLKAYYQIELEAESKNFTAFLTPFGKFRFTRLPMGLSISSNEFDKNYGDAIRHLSNVVRVCEDTLVYGRTEEEFLEVCESFLEACAENNITLNEKKVQWKKEKVVFAGYVIGKDGYEIDPKLNEALAKFPKPENVTDLRSFFGLANQTCNFSDKIAKIMEPLKSLLKKNNLFLWLPEHEEAFQKARELLSSPKTLAFYDPKKQTRLQVDASRLKGLGFVLKQLSGGEWKTVQAGSRFLSEAETRYAMVELELLAIVWSCHKTRMLIEGLSKNNFTIWTDHMPLVPILSKYTLPQITNKRLQRLRMKIDHLSFNIEWVKGKENIEADSLSRGPCAAATKEDELDEEDGTSGKEKIAKICLNLTEINSNENSDARLKEISDAAESDETYQELKKLIIEGFPNVKNNLSRNMIQFFHAREDLHFDDEGYVVFKDRLFIPTELRTTLLKRLLAMHQSSDKMLARARQAVWWPFMNKDVHNIAKTCKPCQEHKQSNRTEPWRHHEVPTYPFEIIHLDFGQHEGRHYLIVADQFSSYPFVKEFDTDPTSDMLIQVLTYIFSLFAIPRKIYSDGGPQMSSFKFKEFCRRWGVNHEMSSPHHAQSNGYAESAIKQMKKIIRGSFIQSQRRVDSESFAAGILLYRNTPCSPTNRSPAEILFGRQLRDNLPVSRKLLKPNLRFDVENRRRDAYAKVDKYSPRVQLPLLRPGTRVFVQNPMTKKWTSEGSVISFGHNEREYLIEMENGKIMRRNRHFLREKLVATEMPPPQPFPPMSSNSQGTSQDSSSSSPTTRSYAEVAATPRDEVETTRNDRPKRDVKKPARFSDKNFVYGQQKNRSRK